MASEATLEDACQESAQPLAHNNIVLYMYRYYRTYRPQPEEVILRDLSAVPRGARAHAHNAAMGSDPSEYAAENAAKTEQRKQTVRAAT